MGYVKLGKHLFYTSLHEIDLEEMSFKKLRRKKSIHQSQIPSPSTVSSA